MDAAKCDSNTLNIDDEIAKTADLIQRLTDAEELIGERRRFFQAQKRKICEEFHQNCDEQLLQRVCNLVIQIFSIEQYPYQPESEPLYDCTGRTVRRERYRSPSLTTAKDLGEPIRKLSFEFRHKSKNLATERKMAKEIQQHEESIQQIDLANSQIDVDANPSYLPWSKIHWRPLPTKDVKTFIKIWAEKVEDLSSLILRDSENSTAPRATAEKLIELVSLGREFYYQMNVGRAEFKQHWDSLKGLKSSIQRIKFDLSKARWRLERRCAKVKQLREKANQMYWAEAELESKVRIIKQQKMEAHIHMLELEKKQDISQVRKKKLQGKRTLVKSRNRFEPNSHSAGFELIKSSPGEVKTKGNRILPYRWL